MSDQPISNEDTDPQQLSDFETLSNMSSPVLSAFSDVVAPADDGPDELPGSSGNVTPEEMSFEVLWDVTSFLPFIKLLPNVTISDNQYYVDGPLVMTELERFAKSTRRIKQITLTDDELPTDNITIASETLIRLGKLEDPTKPYLSSLERLRLINADHTLLYIFSFCIIPSLKSLEIARVPAARQISISSFLKELVFQVPCLPSLTLGPGGISAASLRTSLKFTHLRHLHIDNAAESLDFDFLQDIAALPELESLIIDARTAEYKHCQRLSDTDTACPTLIVTGPSTIPFPHLRKLILIANILLIGDIVYYLFPRTVKDVSLTLVQNGQAMVLPPQWDRKQPDVAVDAIDDPANQTPISQEPDIFPGSEVGSLASTQPAEALQPFDDVTVPLMEVEMGPEPRVWGYCGMEEKKTYSEKSEMGDWKDRCLKEEEMMRMEEMRQKAEMKAEEDMRRKAEMKAEEMRWREQEEMKRIEELFANGKSEQEEKEANSWGWVRSAPVPKPKKKKDRARQAEEERLAKQLIEDAEAELRERERAANIVSQTSFFAYMIEEIFATGSPNILFVDCLDMTPPATVTRNDVSNEAKLSKFPSSTFRTLLSCSTLKELHFAHWSLSRVDEILVDLATSSHIPKMEMERLRLPVNETLNSGIAISTLHLIAAYYPHILNFECFIQTADAISSSQLDDDVVPCGLKYLSLGGQLSISMERKIDIAKHIYLLFPKLQEITTHEGPGYDADGWMIIYHLVRAHQEVSLIEETRRASARREKIGGQRRKKGKNTFQS
ncbi:hypothetical protein BDN70DRAFT_161800 [Pholiota conissans]|uniref:Uncharacterized protein n=1 Tax=Pholiota conissans TaxID=109636 RepID=A0A9P5ZBQ3_9AGAR|nr:hypothetical protein BDN70DRAFT_161800 [Pholiota conissans]